MADLEVSDLGLVAASTRVSKPAWIRWGDAAAQDSLLAGVGLGLLGEGRLDDACTRYRRSPS